MAHPPDHTSEPPPLVDEPHPLDWVELAKEGVSIVIFLMFWYLLAGLLIFVAYSIYPGDTSDMLLAGVFGFLGITVYLSGTFIATIRVLGRSIELGLRAAEY